MHGSQHLELFQTGYPESASSGSIHPPSFLNGFFGTASPHRPFSFLSGHFYGSSNWLATCLHLGFDGVGLYAAVVSAAIALAVSPVPGNVADSMARRLRWLILPKSNFPHVTFMYLGPSGR
jgi:hypothetical protein